jgi:hypothetical protein
MRIRFRILLLIKVMEICNQWSISPPGLRFELLGLHSEHLRLYFEPLKLLTFDFHADLDPTFLSNADPDPQPCYKRQGISRYCGERKIRESYVKESAYVYSN